MAGSVISPMADVPVSKKCFVIVSRIHKKSNTNCFTNINGSILVLWGFFLPSHWRVGWGWGGVVDLPLSVCSSVCLPVAQTMCGWSPFPWLKKPASSFWKPKVNFVSNVNLWEYSCLMDTILVQKSVTLFKYWQNKWPPTFLKSLYKIFLALQVNLLILIEALQG